MPTDTRANGGNTTRSGAAERVAWLGLLLAAALALYGVESVFASPFPFLRIGLANIVTVFVVLAFGAADALLLTVLRVTVASLIVGTFLGPAYVLAMSGGVAAALGMALAARWAVPPLGVIGVSLIGALFHNLAQVAVVGGLFAGVSRAAALVPPVLVVSAATGLGTGLVALFVFERLSVRMPARAPLSGAAAGTRRGRVNVRARAAPMRMPGVHSGSGL